MIPEFKEFEKISRLKRAVTITEKIDGTDAQVHIRAELSDFLPGVDTEVLFDGVGYYLRAGSRNRWLAYSGGEDNFGFSKWVNANAQSLAALGNGTHYGEWWGSGIQRRYGLTEKRFSLFNSSRWTEDTKPACWVVSQFECGARNLVAVPPGYVDLFFGMRLAGFFTSSLFIARLVDLSRFLTPAISSFSSIASGGTPLFRIIIFRTSAPTCSAVFTN